ncbi:MAG TPA: corrinoid protein [Alphaproteobacteria bacterium]|nr:corrinoid protein [Alphaproteobacteria bacterium]
MNHRDTIMAVFRGQEVDVIPWVPRIDLWHNAKVLTDTLPQRFAGMSIDQIHRSLGWPLHKFVPEFQKPARPQDLDHWGLGLVDVKECAFTFEFPSDVDIRVTPEHSEKEEMTHVEYHTPVGMVSVRHGMTTEMKKAGASAGWVKEHAIKGPEDYAPLAHIFGNIKIKPAYERYNAWRRATGDDGVVVSWGAGLGCTSPMHFIQKTFLDATEFYLHHHDYPDQMAALIEALGNYYDQLIEVLAASGVDAVHWSANVDDMITYPALYEEHFLPWCHKASDRLRPEGIIMVIHPDGENQGLMDLVAASRMDVADAVTPWPMTKVRIGDYYDHWCRPGHLTIHGGIPEMLLLEESSTWEELESYMDDFFQAVAPGHHFVASIGDTTPPNADFSRLEYIGERIAREGSLPLRAGDFQPLGEADMAAAARATEPAAAPEVEEAYQRITDDVLEGDEEAVLVHARELLDQGFEAGDILNKGMLPAMDVIGSRFSDGTVFIPEVLLSARAMNQGLELLEPHLVGESGGPGKIVIGTVNGDLHDIGKNMVVSMLKGVGFKVVDLGANVEVVEFVEAVRDEQPDVLGLSALLTTTMPQIREVIEGLEHSQLRRSVKVIIGGAPVNQKFADDAGADGYAQDAGEAVTLTKRLLLV